MTLLHIHNITHLLQCLKVMEPPEIHTKSPSSFIINLIATETVHTSIELTMRQYDFITHP